MTVENRSSGAKIYSDVIVKVGEGVGEQATFMEDYPKVFCPVIERSTDFCIMPEMQKFDLNTPVQVVECALRKLSILWESESTSQRASLPEQRHQYNQYVTDNSPSDIWEVTELYYKRVKDFKGTPVANIHGDATLQNIVWSESTAFWIDPNVRAVVPREQAVDIGKLLQSLEGYDRFGLTQIDPITSLLEDLSGEELLLSRYYLLTHLCRLWRYQDSTIQQWALQVTQRYGGLL